MPDLEMLHDFASKYVWWRPATTAVEYPQRVISQVMNLGSYDDIVRLEKNMTPDELKAVLDNAEPGQFSDKSWRFWHLRLKIAEADIPAPPRRRFE